MGAVHLAGWHKHLSDKHEVVTSNPGTRIKDKEHSTYVRVCKLTVPKLVLIILTYRNRKGYMISSGKILVTSLFFKIIKHLEYNIDQRQPKI